MATQKTKELAKTKRIVQKKSTTPSPQKAVEKQNLKKSLFTKRNIIIAVIVVLLVLGGLFAKNKLMVATVNGEPIGHLQFIKELQKQEGKKVLDNLITQKLILQETAKKNISVNDAEVDAELNKIKDSIKQSGQSFDEILTSRGLTINSVKEQIRNNLLIKKLLGDKIKVSDKEVSDYMEKNKESLPEEGNPEEQKENIRLQLEQQKLQEKAQELITNLQNKAKINYFIKL